jgi:hypothetical protein
VDGLGAYPPARARTKRTASAEDFEGAKLSHIGCVYAVPKRDEESISCLALLARLFRARVGFYWPEGFAAAGMVEKAAYEDLVGRLQGELEQNEQKARERETEIIQVARELELFPEPTGTGPDYWCATCPEKNHPLYINAATSSFWYGWCGRKGGVEELRAFVTERCSGGGK